VPPLTRWFLRTALAWLVLAMLAGVAITLPTVGPEALHAALQPVWVHLLMVGWVTQMIFGVAWWMFPRPAPARSFGNPVLGWSAYAALNAGLLLRVLSEPALATAPGPGVRAALVASAALQFFATLAFAATIWPRTRGT